MVIEDNMEFLEVYVGATSISLNDRFSMLAATSPFRGAAPRRARRRSINDGPLRSRFTAGSTNQNLVDEVVQQLGLQWTAQMLDLQPEYNGQNGNWRRSRAGSVNGSEASIPRLARSNSYGNLSRAGSVGNLSQRSGRSRRSSGAFSDQSRTVAFSRSSRLDLNRRLQMRDAWMRGRRGRGRWRGRGRGGQNQRGGVAYHNWSQQPRQRRRRGRGRGRGRGWYVQGSRTQGVGNQSGPGSGRGGWRGRGTGRGRGRGRGGSQRGGFIPQNGMPVLKTLEELDKELDEYMASTPATLDKQLEEYMAQNGLEMDME